MRALLVPELGEVSFGESEDFALLQDGEASQCLFLAQAIHRKKTHLVDTTELKVDVQVLLIERLQAWVEQTTEERTADLLDDFCTSFLCIVLSHASAEAVIVHVVRLRQLVAAADDENEPVGGHADGAEDGEEDVSVVVYTMSHELDGCLQVV